MMRKPLRRTFERLPTPSTAVAKTLPFVTGMSGSGEAEARALTGVRARSRQGRRSRRRGATLARIRCDCRRRGGVGARTVPAGREDGVVSDIGVLREGPLHAAVKALLARPGDRAEVKVGRFVIDLVRADGELVEVQTGGFTPLGPKLDALLDAHRMRIVHPIAAERRIVRVDAHGEVLSARRSPVKGGPLAIFERLVTFPSLLAHPNLVLELLLCAEDHVRAPEPKRGRRFLRDPGERRLREVVGRIEPRTPADALARVHVPPAPFTNRDLADALPCPPRLAERITYCLRHMGALEAAGKRGRAALFTMA